ncbi:MAG: hypothetical protein SGPRY_015047 [Prymnesium sp.]
MAQSTALLLSAWLLAGGRAARSGEPCDLGRADAGDASFLGCHDWCSPAAASFHCEWCHCGSCAFCARAQHRPRAPAPPRPLMRSPPPSTLACSSTHGAAEGDERFADCKAWCEESKTGWQCTCTFEVRPLRHLPSIAVADSPECCRRCEEEPSCVAWLNSNLGERGCTLVQEAPSEIRFFTYTGDTPFSVGASPTTTVVQHGGWL